MSDALAAATADAIDRLVPGGTTILVAVSGGPDSLALAELLVRGAAGGRPLRLVHVDHGIGADSAAVARAIAAYAAARQLPCDIVTLALGPAASETTARRARRAALRELLPAHAPAVIALAHHADDQAETVLLRVLRGSGPMGLSAMAPRRGPWIRPLLGVRREALAGFLTAAGLAGWADPANADPRHLRSWLRTAILPTLAGRLPDIHDRLLDVSRQAAAVRAGVNQLPELLAGLDWQAEQDGFSVAAPPLRGYRSEVQQLLLEAMGRRCGVPLGATRRARIVALLAGGRSGARVRLAEGLVAELAGGRLHLRRPGPPSFASTPLPDEGELAAGPLRLRVARRPAGPASRIGAEAFLPPGDYLVRPWRAGDRIAPLGGTGSRRVVVLLREAGIPAGRRPGWPVVADQDDEATIVWVPGICRAGARQPRPGEDALHVTSDLA